jgi:hypothetical protein
MNINKAKLQEALEIVKPGLANKEIIEQATSFAFIGGRVVTYNDEISISHPIEGLNLNGAIQAENLYKFLAKIKKDDVDFELKENEIILSTGRSKAGLTLQAEIKLPLDDDIAKKGKWYDLPDNFNKFVSFAMASCSTDMSRQVITCVHIRKSGIIEASDSYRITHCVLSDDMPVKTFLLPASSAINVVKLNPIKIAEGTGWIHFQTEEGTIISCRIFEDTYPDTSVFLKSKGNQIIFPQTLSEALERAQIFAKRDHILDESVSIIIENRKICIGAESDSSWYKEDMNMKYEGSKIVFSITPYLLKGILSETNACIINEDGSKLKFEGEGWQYVTMLKE